MTHIDPALLHNPDVAHEHSDVDIRTILSYGIGMFVLLFIVAVLMYFLFGFFETQAARNDPETSPLATPATQMPPTTTGSPFFGAVTGAPQLLTNEPAALLKQRALEQERLHVYGWADEKTGVARMPIDEAKKLILQRGLPVRQAGPIDPALGTYAPAMGESSGGRTVPTGRPAAQPAPAAKASGSGPRH